MTGTSVADLWWPIWHRGGRLEELDARECRRLLAGTTVGRLAYQTMRGPRIIPMNYALVADSIVTCTAPDTEIARIAPKQTVAFEIDHADGYLQRGWSVLVVGELGCAFGRSDPHVVARTDAGPLAGGPSIGVPATWNQRANRSARASGPVNTRPAESVTRAMSAGGGTVTPPSITAVT